MVWVSGPLVYISNEPKEQWLGRWQKTLHRAQAMGSLMPELQASLWVCSIPCHGKGMSTASTLTGSPLSHKPFICPARRQKIRCNISHGHVLPRRRAHSFAPVITGHTNAMNYSSQAWNIFQRARCYPGGLVHGLLPWVLTLFPPLCAELHHITV